MCRERIIERMEMFDMAKVLCCTCRKVTDYTIHSRVTSHEISGKDIIFREKYATCSECGSEVTVPGLDDDNTRELESVYSGLKGCGLL